MSRIQKQPSVQERDYMFAIHLFGHVGCGTNFLKRLELSLDDTSYGENDYGGEELVLDGGVIAYSSRFGNRDQQRLFPLCQPWYSCYYDSGREAIMVVVDSTSSVNDIKAACHEAGIEWVSNLLLFRYAVIMVVADKQDEETAHSPDKIESALKEMATERWSNMTWLVFPCRGHTNDDIRPAYECLKKLMHLNRTGRLRPGLIHPTSHDESDQASQFVTEDETDDIPCREAVNRPPVNVINFNEIRNSLKSHMSLIRRTLSF